MEKYLLDSSMIIDVISGRESARPALAVFKAAEVFTSIICYCEVLNATGLGKLAKAREFMEKLSILALSLQDGETAAELALSSKRAGKHVPTMDCLIAATALNNNCVLVASDRDFERIEGVSKLLF